MKLSLTNIALHVLTGALLLLLAVGVVFRVRSCGSGPSVQPPPRPAPKFFAGQMIRSKLDGRVGQVVYVGDFFAPITYRVRFRAEGAAIRPQTLGPAVRPGDYLYVEVEFQEFELEENGEKKP